MPAFVMLVILIPVAYGVTTWNALQDTRLDAGGMGVMAAVLAAISGAVQFWDVAVRPGPKLGSDWQFSEVKDYLTQAGLFHLLIMPIVVNGLVYLFPPGGVPQNEIGRLAAAIAWGGFLGGYCLSVPKTSGGPHSGNPLTTGGRSR